MKAWLRWSLWQLYLIFFWPSRFQREIEGFEPGQPRLSLRQRAVYLLKLSPWTVLVPVLVNLAVGLSVEAYGLSYAWDKSWAFGVASGVALQTALVIENGVANGMALGIAFGVALDIAFGAANGVTSTGAIFAILGKMIVLGIILGIGTVLIVANDMILKGLGTMILVMFGMALILANGKVFGVESGVLYRLKNGAMVDVIVIVAFALVYFRLFAYPFDWLPG